MFVSQIGRWHGKVDWITDKDKVIIHNAITDWWILGNTQYSGFQHGQSVKNHLKESSDSSLVIISRNDIRTLE